MQNEQLDRMAAEKIMGWRVRTFKSGHRTWARANGEVVGFDDDFEFTPTTKEAHAAIVREKMRADGWEVCSISHKRGDTVTVEKNDTPHTYFAEAGHMPLAITSAALLAVGAITEEQLNG